MTPPVLLGRVHFPGKKSRVEGLFTMTSIQRNLFVLLVALATLLGGPVPLPHCAAQEKDTVKAVETTKAPPLSADAAKRCDATWKRIQDFYQALPKDLTGITSSAADQLSLETEKTLIVCGQYLAECEGHASYHEGEYVTAKLLFLLSGRRRAEWIAVGGKRPDAQEWIQGKVSAYMADVEKLARQAFEHLPADNPLRPRAIEIVGQSCAEADKFEEARKAYEKFLELFPKDSEADRITLALGRAFYDMNKFDEGIKVIKAGIEKYYSSQQFPFFGEIHWKLVHAKGDLSGMAECVKRIETVYPLKLKGTSLMPQERENYERFYDFNGFRKGYTLFAQGDFAGAREAFKEHIRYLDSKEEALRKENKDLKPEVRIYRDRSVLCLKVVDELAGLPAPADFDLGTAWVTQKKVRADQSRGKVVALVFRGVNDDRSAAFIGPVSQFVARRPEADMVCVSYRKSGLNLGQQMDDLKEELGRLGYDGAAGFDPDDTQKTIFRRYLANVGSATFIILNRRGELVWYMQDPRGVDVQFAEALIERVSKQ
jgi:tetratricopeptide (TPR) repeat protein